ncbi:MAG TPA: YkgJ family cysteine cluster protein [Gemmatimonadales bacterium]|nr:YkgJ family cysteine cluster protein [Gemmatimonadales bacterium]
MSPGTVPRAGTAAYRGLLERLDRWFEQAREATGVIPCRSGCSACCHGPFDVTVADVELLREGVAELAPAERAGVVAQAGALLTAMTLAEPTWTSPYAVADLGEERFDALIEGFAETPCPLLDEGGRCRIYRHRPLVCRLIGLGMITPTDRLIENACPIQHAFPAYEALPPRPFDLEALELEEIECQRGAARRLFGDAGGEGYETTIAAAIVEGEGGKGKGEGGLR